MNQRKRRMVALAATTVLALGTSASGASGPADKPQDDALNFARGAQAWASNCARCHNMRDAAELRDDQWRPVVAHMRLRAGLTATESRQILQFLQQSN